MIINPIDPLVQKLEELIERLRKIDETLTAILGMGTLLACVAILLKACIK